jgi:hypothetical protein
MKKLSKLKEYAARYLHEVINMDISEIGKEIGASVESITTTLGLNENKTNNNIKTVTNKANTFINETAVKRTKNVTIMTQSASQAGDESKIKTNLVRQYKNAIYKSREQP